MGAKAAETTSYDWIPVDEEIEKRLVEVTTWLKDNALTGSLRPDPGEMGSVERAYWHYGYLSALQDMRAVLVGRQRKGN